MSEQPPIAHTLRPSATRLRTPLLALTILALVALLAVVPFEEFQFWAWDFSVFRAGSKALLSGANPYDPQNVVRYSDGAELASIPYYVYAPFFAVLIAPLTLFPPMIASRIWFIVNLGCLLGASLLLLRTMQWQPTPRGLALMAIALAVFPPTRTLLVIGQSTGLMLLALVVSVHLSAKGRPWLAGAALGIAFFKPHLVLVPLFLLMKKQWKLVTAQVMTLVLITLPFMGLVEDWIRSLAETRLVNLGYGCVDFSSLIMLLQCLGLSSRVILGILTVPVVVAVWLLRPPAQPGTSLHIAQLGLIVSLTLVVLDNVRVADLTLLIFPAAVVIQLGKQQSRALVRLSSIALLLAGYLSPYLAQAWGAATGATLLYSLPIWYSGIAVAVFLALAVLLVSGAPGRQETPGRLVA